MDRGEFTGCTERTCQRGEWTNLAEKRGWFQIPGSEKFLCPAHRPDSYESATGHEITCLAGVGLACDCERVTVRLDALCARCGHRMSKQIEVPAVMGDEQRKAYGFSRAGWTHSTTEGTYTDLCQVCARGIDIKESGDGVVTVTVEDYVFLDDSARVLEFGLERKRLVHLYEAIGRHLK